MEIIFEIVFQIIFELIFEGLLQVSPNKKKKKKKKTTGPIVGFFAYCVMGAVAGIASLMILPHQLIAYQMLIYANLIITPVIAGLVMSYIGYLRKRKGKNVIRLDTFFYGFSFALVMALVRFWFAS